MKANISKIEAEEIIYPDEEEANKDLFQGEPEVDFDPWDHAFKAYKSPDRFFDEDGYALYNFDKDGKEYSCELFERYKGLVSYCTFNKANEDFKSFYVGACKRGEEQNFIAFDKPLQEIENSGEVYEKALELAREILKDEENGPRPRSLNK
jgi:hypothetical protein